MRSIQIMFGSLAFVMCLIAVAWGIATNVRDRDPGFIEQETGPDIVIEDIVRVSGLRDMTRVKLTFVLLLVVSSAGVAIGAFEHA